MTPALRPAREAHPDEGMAEMIAEYLEKVLKRKAQAEIIKQQKEQFPEGWEEKEGHKKPTPPKRG